MMKVKKFLPEELKFLTPKEPFKIPYAPIDLKNATIYIMDGFTGTSGNGAVNNVGGYTAGTTTLTVDTFTGTVATDTYITIAGSKASNTNRLTRHRVTAASGSPTTSITITPGLDAAILDDAVITIQPHQIEVKIGEGQMTYTENREIEYIRDRGRLSTVREGDEQTVEVSLDFIWEFIRADTSNFPTVEDALKQRGQASSWVSSSSDACEPYAVDILIWYNPPCSGEKDEEILLSDFRWESLEHNLVDATVSISGNCNVKEATVSRIA